MARPQLWDVDDKLWAVVEPPLPEVGLRRPGRYRHRSHRHLDRRPIPLLQAVPPMRGRRRRPRRRTDVVLGDRGYDHDTYRRLVRDLGVKPPIARRWLRTRLRLGDQLWVVERAFAHLHWFHRLRIRWETVDDVHEAFLTPRRALICWRHLVAVQRRHS